MKERGTERKKERKRERKKEKLKIPNLLFNECLTLAARNYKMWGKFEKKERQRLKTK